MAPYLCLWWARNSILPFAEVACTGMYWLINGAEPLRLKRRSALCFHHTTFRLLQPWHMSVHTPNLHPPSLLLASKASGQWLPLLLYLEPTLTKISKYLSLIHYPESNLFVSFEFACLRRRGVAIPTDGGVDAGSIPVKEWLHPLVDTE
jgi:hypothetical protein